MYFVTYEMKGIQQIGLLAKAKNGIIPLQSAEKEFFHQSTLPGTMMEFLEQGEAALTIAKKIADRETNSTPLIDFKKVRLLAPIPKPRKNIFCIGKNYREHALEFEKTKDPNIAVPKFPVIFSKPPTAVIGPDAVIKSHSEVTQALDYEVELAVVIGRRGSYIAQADAMDYVFGYTIINDVTARDLQQRHAQWLKGKGLDTFAPMGPYLVHKSEIPDPENLSISLKVNGEIRQNANTGDLVFKIPELIATISAGITLEPGDVIATGTPAGVGAGFEPPRFLKPGDKLELAIAGLGVLCNTVG